MKNLFIFVFPFLRTPTEEEMEGFKDYIIMFYEFRYELISFELAYA
jgi:hypothetical protein